LPQAQGYSHLQGTLRQGGMEQQAITKISKSHLEPKGLTFDSWH
jgi:hypothetical protein